MREAEISLSLLALELWVAGSELDELLVEIGFCPHHGAAEIFEVAAA